ncbi:ParA family protein [Pseudomonas caricapapayae]|uniref:ParA family protein n=1 Tax=Pseudomonas caricapapayae TaxID=46678 RepID=UPI000F008AEA|nr:ParA family protein [Pseudomonas caricapapayae]
MKVTAVIAGKGGIGKSTTAMNLGAICADAGLRTLVIDADPQPSASSFFPMEHNAPCGFYELISRNETRLDQVISRTTIPNLSIIYSDDPTASLVQMMLNAPDGRLRLRNLVKAFADFDLVIIDTQGSRSVLQEMAVLASDLALSPIQPQMLSAREFSRGTGQLFRDLEAFSSFGITIPKCKVVINMMDHTADAKLIAKSIRDNFNQDPFSVLENVIPTAVSFRSAATQGMPAHRIEPRNPTDRKAGSALDIMRALAIELYPEWTDRFTALSAERVEALVRGAV